MTLALALSASQAAAAGSLQATSSDSAGITVDAAQVELVDGVIRGEGDVRARFGADVATARSFALDLEAGELELWEGRWLRQDGQGGYTEAFFAHAVIDLRARGGQLEAATMLTQSGRLRLAADTLSWAADGVLAGSHLRLTTCDCDAPPWEVSARHVRLDDRRAGFRGGLLRLCGLPILPLPAGRIPLRDRASGLLPPELAYGQDGLVVGLPVYLVTGRGSDLTVGPELRTLRGERVLVDGRGAWPAGQGRLRVAAGWDRLTGGPRGAMDLEEGWADGPWRVAVDGLAESDADYISDYGSSFLSRSLPWAESRATLGLRGLGKGALGAASLRLEHDSFQVMGDGSTALQRLGAAQLGLVGQRLGAVSLDASGRVDAMAQGRAGWDLVGPLIGRVQADLQAAASQSLGPARVGLKLSGAVRSWTDGSAWGEGRSSATLWLPGWMDLPTFAASGSSAQRTRSGGRLVTELGMELGAASLTGTADARTIEDLPAPAWSLGPVARARLLTLSGVPISAGGKVLWTPSGLTPDLWVQARGGALSLLVHTQPELQDLSLGVDTADLSLSAGLMRVPAGASWQSQLGVSLLPELTQPTLQLETLQLETLQLETLQLDELLQTQTALSLRLPGPLSEWRPGYKLLVDLAGQKVLQQGPQLHFSSRCGCLDAALGAIWSVDRSDPDLSLQVQLR